MKLSARTLLLGHIILGLGLLCFLLISELYTRPALASLEEESLATLSQTIHNLIASEVSTLDKFGQDWALWDDSLEFMYGKNSNYEKNNLNAEAFASIGVRMLIFVRLDGTLFWGRKLDDSGTKLEPIEGVNDLLPILNASRRKGKTDGLVRFRDGDYLFAGATIHGVSVELPSPGALYFMKEMDAGFWNSLSLRAGVRVTASHISQLPKEGTKLEIRRTDDQRTVSHFSIFLSNVNASSGLAIEGDLDRPIENVGSKTIQLYSLVIGLCLAFLVWSFLVYLRLDIVRPIKELNRIFVKMKRDKNYAARTNFRRSDELGELSRDIDDLISTVEQHNRSLEDLALSDGLTGLSNRRGLDKALELVWKICRREKRPLALIMVDIDFFKAYNDNLGHPQGDECLKKIGHIINDAARRPSDVKARYGGEEFAILLPGVELEGCVIVAEKLQAALSEAKIPHPTSESGFVTLSMGCASEVPGQDSTAGGLVARADKLLYTAKKSGRNRIEF